MCLVYAPIQSLLMISAYIIIKIYETSLRQLFVCFKKQKLMFLLIIDSQKKKFQKDLFHALWFVVVVVVGLVMFPKRSLATYCFYSVSYYVPQTKFGNILFLLCFLLLLLLFFFFYFLLLTYLSASVLIKLLNI